MDQKRFRTKESDRLNKKLNWLNRPLFNVKNTVICYNLTNQPPQYVIDTLALGPNYTIIDKFDRNDILADFDGLLSFCKGKELGEDIITDINVKILAYIKNCQKQKPSRNIQMTKKYLKENNLLAIPFDKSITRNLHYVRGSLP